MGDNNVEPPAEVEQPVASAESAPCTICLTPEFHVESRVNGCDHPFCFVCISEWACTAQRASCPMCRKDIENITYDFISHPKGRVQIGIREYRSIHLSLTPSERNQLLGERRLVVRNLMHVFKVASEVASELTENSNQEGEDAETLKVCLTELDTAVKEHIGKAERILGDLRMEQTRKNKGIVFTNPTFRRMLYTAKCRIKFLDMKKKPVGKLKPEDLSKEPDRYRSIVTEFLISEFDALPLAEQPQSNEKYKWRTRFFGQTMEVEEKLTFATRIYEMMLAHETGSDELRKDLMDLLVPVDYTHIVILDEHLNAIVSVKEEDIHEFYKAIYYDSVYNTITNRTVIDSAEFDNIIMNGGMVFEEGDRARFDELFRSLARGPDVVFGDLVWPDPFSVYERRFVRQSSNTDRTDRATNNDDESVRSDSPEPRVPTPRPGPSDEVTDEEIQQLLDRIDPLAPGPYIPPHLPQRERIRYEFYRRVDHMTPTFELHHHHHHHHHHSSQTLPRLRTLRNNERRQREIQERTRIERVRELQPRPVTRRDIRSERVRNFVNRSDQFPPRGRDRGEPTAANRRYYVFGTSEVAAPVHTINETPIYIPANQDSISRRPRTRFTESPVGVEEELAQANMRHIDTGFRRESRDGNYYSIRPEGSGPPEASSSAVGIAFLNAINARDRAAEERANAEDIGEPYTIGDSDVESTTETMEQDNMEGETLTLGEYIDEMERADQEAGLDFISVAHRTRAARRAAASGNPPGAPPAKRAPNSGRD